MSGSARHIGLSIPPARWVGVAQEAGRTRTLVECEEGGVVEICNRLRRSVCEIVGRSEKVDVGRSRLMREVKRRPVFPPRCYIRRRPLAGLGTRTTRGEETTQWQAAPPWQCDIAIGRHHHNEHLRYYNLEFVLFLGSSIYQVVLICISRIYFQNVSSFVGILR